MLPSLLQKLGDDADEAAVIAGEALALAPHGDHIRWAETLARESQPLLQAASLEARSLANALSAGDLLAVFRSGAARTVRWAAARAAARFQPDPRIDELLLAELHGADDPELAWEIARALALRGLPAGYFAISRIQPWPCVFAKRS